MGGEDVKKILQSRRQGGVVEPDSYPAVLMAKNV
jgi:hypothetical protein